VNYTGLLQSALVALLRNKMRSILTVLGITIGIAAVEQQLNNLGDNFVWIEAAGRAVNGVRTGTHDTKTLVGDPVVGRLRASEVLKRLPTFED